MEFLKGIKNSALLPREQWCSKSQKMISNTSFLKVPSFIYLYPLVEMLRGIKVRLLQNSEDFIHHQMNEYD